MSKLTFYGYLICPFAQRVRFALEALKIDYEFVHIDLHAGAQKEEAYLKINPFGKLPSIQIDGKVVYESLILLEFLGDRFGGVFPKDDIAKAENRIWANYFDQNVASKVFPLFGLKKANNQEGIEKHAQEILNNIKFFTQKSGLEDRIKNNPKGYFNGDQLSFVDFVVAPHIRNIETFFKLFVGRSIYSFAEPNESIQNFEKYSKNLLSSQPYLSITDNLKQLPPIETNSFLKDLGVDSIEKFNYEHFFKEFHQKKFLS
ncbi:hypothetical protein ABPG74_000773 [Tetrahymena malaccensis]